MSAWTKVAAGAAIASGLGAIVATVWIGALVREETVVANPYQEGLRLTEDRGVRPAAAVERSPCDLGAAACTLPLDGGGEVTLELSPRPLRTMTELRVRAVVRGGARAAEAQDVVVGFSMVGMEMGRNEVRLAPADGALAGTGVLVRCPSGRKDWVAEVRVGRAGGLPRAVRFPFTVEE